MGPLRSEDLHGRFLDRRDQVPARASFRDLVERVDHRRREVLEGDDEVLRRDLPRVEDERPGLLFFGSRESISTLPGKKNFRPSVLSVALKTPYSPCMSKIRTDPTSRDKMPAQTSLLRIDLPVPVRPKMAKGFSTSLFMSSCT